MAAVIRINRIDPTMFTTQSTHRARQAVGGALASAALLGALLAPSAALAKTHHSHRAKRAEAPTTQCDPGELAMTGRGKEARLWVCTDDGTWTEAVYAVSKGGHTSTVNAGRS